MNYTIRMLSIYQIEQLKELFGMYNVEKIGRIEETGDLLIEYKDGIEQDAVMKTISIPAKPKDATNVIGCTYPNCDCMKRTGGLDQKFECLKQKEATK